MVSLRFFISTSPYIFQETAEMCVCGLFLLDLFSFILAEGGQEEKILPCKCFWERKKKVDLFIYSVQIKANLNHGTFVIQL